MGFKSVDTQKRARRAGVANGVRSILRITGRGRPAPAIVRRESGSLQDDAQQLRRDSERLFREQHA